MLSRIILKLSYIWGQISVKTAVLSGVCMAILIIVYHRSIKTTPYTYQPLPERTGSHLENQTYRRSENGSTVNTRIVPQTKKAKLYIHSDDTWNNTIDQTNSTSNIHLKQSKRVKIQAIKKQPEEETSNSNDLFMKQITYEEAVDRFAYKASDKCVNTCQYVDDEEGAKESIKSAEICQTVTRKLWPSVLSKSSIGWQPFLTNNEYIFPFEKKYLSYAPLGNDEDLPDPKLSRVVFDSEDQDGQKRRKGKRQYISCKIGQRITGMLHLVRRNGRPRTSGGDEIRAWLGALRNNGGKKVKHDLYPRAMAQVIDLDNGSYKIEVTCLWAGSSHLTVDIRYPREFLRMAVDSPRSGYSRFLGATFQRGKVEEDVPCMGTPNVPGRPCICNLTSINGGAPYYCARPLNPKLSCEDWNVAGTLTTNHSPGRNWILGRFGLERQNGSVPTDHILFITDLREEKDAQDTIDMIFGDADHSDYSSRDIRVDPKKTEHMVDTYKFQINDTKQMIAMAPPPRLACKEAGPVVTWNPTLPTGYWNNSGSSKRVWVSLLCREPLDTPEWMKACLLDSTVWVFGDSNGIRQYYRFANGAGINHPSYDPMPFFDVFTSSSNNRKDQTSNVNFSPHEHPLFVTKSWKKLEVDHTSVVQKIDNIPSNGRQFVIIHYFLHVTYFHLAFFKSRLVAARGAVERLLKRNPQALVGIRGPHTLQLDNGLMLAIGGDNLGRFMIQIIREVFAGLYDRVVFLDGWELSVTLENIAKHPFNIITTQIARRFLAFVCDKSVVNSTKGS